jgi:hypothetical protein
MKKTKWSHREFNMVDWISHEKAFKRLTRHQQITMAKLIHNLANTNKQNFLYYKTSPLCPVANQRKKRLNILRPLS